MTTCCCYKRMKLVSIQPRLEQKRLEKWLQLPKQCHLSEDKEGGGEALGLAGKSVDLLTVLKTSSESLLHSRMLVNWVVLYFCLLCCWIRPSHVPFPQRDLRLLVPFNFWPLSPASQTNFVYSPVQDEDVTFVSNSSNLSPVTGASLRSHCNRNTSQGCSQSPPWPHLLPFSPQFPCLRLCEGRLPGFCSNQCVNL